MKMLPFLCLLICVASCRHESDKGPSAQEIVDKAIQRAGGDRYRNSGIAFRFRDRDYRKEITKDGILMKRITVSDSDTITDIFSGNGFKRLVNGSLVAVPDSMAVKYSNSINSVFYFASLPYGLNDRAVNKEYMGIARIGDTPYHKVRVTFDKEGGGKDYEDEYVYWFSVETYEPEYLAYDYHVDGGGSRFRKAYNERYVDGIRFVDYYNYAPTERTDPAILDKLYENGELNLLSNIELREIEVISDSYN
jgi:hypothetical protein